MIKEMANDEAVQATNDDASECKKYAVQCGYWSDPFINYFVKHTNKKTPEINRGYYARVKGVEVFIDKFLKLSGGKGQIINLGAGFDTLYWKLKDAGNSPVNFIELDFSNITAKKCYHIKKQKQLIDRLNTEDGEIRFSSTELHAANYHLVGVDLRHTSDLANKLSQAEVNFNLPTLFLAECVLVYIETNSASSLLQWFAGKFPNSLFINYEQVNMRDKFGQVMLSNLRSRGCLLAGVEDCESLETQQRRFTVNGWEGSNSWTMVEVYDSLPESERIRIERIELLDERELLTQLLQHYCIAVAWNGTMFKNLSIAQG
ncbi:leucine carboxyl methyltransferase 1 [Leptopilina heterotoma]|uniref:leucine carboxyl methyltransferase 1 n=1 Tax=Leptopilina heterotoma TaxID=63436 RepID=UPI001CA7C2FF|nr:leucine carboxyl methyltransferase 1 [Leptopilina heterotoma]XP_043460872.1 leucine carboxyl methyltransferase 1 [Leptopilina heterotoma]XP_043460873.1 leucine carboxyl methyltransferase 1 [Leptopilina heterotoma]